ncbi:MAG TPA: Hsp20/alpha crystallin family protein [Stellaceae bacterium]|nr:Hsp20/alpha crystallin family protein [Stellaceae bacterium]
MATTPVSVKQAPTLRTVGSDPWQAFRGEMDRLFDRFAGGFFGFPSMRKLFDFDPLWQGDAMTGMTVPAVDISEGENAFKVTAEFPGMTEKDIDVTVTGDLLVLKGEKRQEHEEKDKNRYLAERSYGSFQRSFYLPDSVARDKVTAEFSNGVLTVMLPKTVAAKALHKKVEVKAA